MSVIGQTNDAQDTENFYAYSGYGETQILGPDGGNTLQYSGREYDATGLYYYRARYYDPLLKRFTAEDPIGLQGGLNLYAYVGGDPITFNDPAGQCQQAVWSGSYIITWIPCGQPNPSPYPSFPTVPKPPRSPDMCYPDDPVPGPPYPPASPVPADPARDAITPICPECMALGGARWWMKGYEIAFGRNFRVAPMGNRTGGIGELPHYHRRITDANGNTVPGGGIGRHRPWEGL